MSLLSSVLKDMIEKFTGCYIPSGCGRGQARKGQEWLLEEMVTELMLKDGRQLVY